MSPGVVPRGGVEIHLRITQSKCATNYKRYRMEKHNEYDNADYSPPTPLAPQGLNHPLPELGTQDCRDKLFCLDPSFAYLNHGSYGATFRACLDVQAWHRAQMERQPVMWMEENAIQGEISASSATSLKHSQTLVAHMSLHRPGRCGVRSGTLRPRKALRSVPSGKCHCGIECSHKLCPVSAS